MDDHPIFLWGEVTAPDPRPEIISPSQPAALAASHQSCSESIDRMKLTTKSASKFPRKEEIKKPQGN